MRMQEYIKKHKVDLSPDYFDICCAIFEMRCRSGFTQAVLARKIKTKQPSLARVESGECEPSITYLNKVAKATGYKVSVSIKKVGRKNGFKDIVIDY